MSIKDGFKKVLPPSTKMIDRRYDHIMGTIDWVYQEQRRQAAELLRIQHAASLVAIGKKHRSELTFLNGCIVAVASYGKRIATFSKMLETLLMQDTYAFKTVVILPESDFPHKFVDLPADVLYLLDALDAEVLWAQEDFKSHNKYYWPLKKYPETTLITLDDDCYYPGDVIKTLWNAHEQYANCVVALRTHRMKFSTKGTILPYDDWEYDQQSVLNTPSAQLFPTGVGGVLYPAAVFGNQLLQPKLIKDLCLGADDIWLKFNTALTHTKVVNPDYHVVVENIEDSQYVGLAYENTGKQGKNDTYISQVLAWLESFDAGKNAIQWIREDGGECE